jgi:hypothetical protein
MISYRILAVHKQSPSHRFPALLWDSLPHGGASQVHPHIHVTVHSDQYYGLRKKKIFFFAENFFSFQVNLNHYVLHLNDTIVIMKMLKNIDKKIIFVQYKIFIWH